MIRLFSLLALGLATLVGGTSIAGAQSMLDLKGNWTGTSSSIVSGLPPHHPTTLTAKPAGPNRLTEVKFTITVDGQAGGRFWGTLSSPASTDPFIGVLSSDAKRLRMVLQRGGIIDGTVINPDTVEIFYTEHGNGVSVAATNTFTRQK